MTALISNVRLFVKNNKKYTLQRYHEDEYLSLLAMEAKNDIFHDWEDVKRELLTK